MHNDVCIIKGDNKLLCGRSGFPPPSSVLSGRGELYEVLVKTVQISALQELRVLLYDKRCPLLWLYFMIVLENMAINQF